MNIMILKTIMIFSISFFFLIHGEAIDTQNEGFLLGGSEVKIIDVHSNCMKLSNTSNVDYFVPTKLESDWNHFLNNLPELVTTGDCCTNAGTFFNDYSTTLGPTSRGEGTWRTMASYTVTNCGSYTVHGYLKISSPDRSKGMQARVRINSGERYISLYRQIDGSLKTYNVSYSKTVSELAAGDTIHLQGWVWGNYGNDRFSKVRFIVSHSK